MARETRILTSVPFLATLVFTFSTMLPVSCIAKSTDPAIQRIRSGAELGFVDKQIELGADYFIGRGVDQNERLAAYWYEKAAGAGDPIAQQQIGYFYQTGLGVPVDQARAVHWFQLAASGGLASAKVNLGVAYIWGLGVPKNPALAAQLFHEAFRKGVATAAFDLGDMYYFGHGVPQDMGSAEHWFEAGARLRDAPSAHRLALMLVEKKDRAILPKAVDLLRESAHAGYVPAMHSLGLLLVRNPELTSSMQEAITLVDAASKAGTWKSSILLGVLARDGKWMPADDKAAMYHFQLAILQGGDEAETLIKHDVTVLSAKLGASQSGAIQSQANAWFQQHHLALQFIYRDGYNRKQFPAFALAEPAPGIHAGRLIPTPAARADQIDNTSAGGAPKEGEREQPLANTYFEE